MRKLSTLRGAEEYLRLHRKAGAGMGVDPGPLNPGSTAPLQLHEQTRGGALSWQAEQASSKMSR